MLRARTRPRAIGADHGQGALGSWRLEKGGEAAAGGGNSLCKGVEKR